MSDHERFDTEIRSKLLIGLGLVLVVTCLLAALASYGVQKGLLSHLERQDPPPPILAEAANPPSVAGPRLLSAPERVLHRVRAQEDRILEWYAWVDEGSGTVTIPIERAIEIAAERGLATVAPGFPIADPVPDEPAEEDGT